MSILLDQANRVLVMGVTGNYGKFFATDSGGYGTTIVAGVSPGRGGGNVEGIPVYESAQAACRATRDDTAMVFVPPPLVRAAAIEAIDAGCKLVVATADEMPVRDTIEIRAAAKANGARLVGPNSPGIISPGKAKMGFMPSFCFTRGPMGVISRSGSLSYESSKRLTLAGIGQTTVIGIGGDPIKGTTAAEALALFHDDPETQAITYLGEIGGSEEVAVAEYAKQSDAKPVAALIVGKTAPPGKKMGHAAALVGSKADGHAAKTKMLAASGVHVCKDLTDLVNQARASLAKANGHEPRINTDEHR